MRPLRRPTLHWLLWLVIALLPLRGWAWAQMAGAAGHALVSAAAQTVVHTPPCHGHLAASGVTSPTEAPTEAPTDAHAGAPLETAATSHGTCGLCGVCHASLGLTAMPELVGEPGPHSAPVSAPTPLAPDQPPSRHFRPPRVVA